jgi:hypothetical protein
MGCDRKRELEQLYHSAVREFQQCLGEHSAALNQEHSDAAQDRLNRLKKAAEAALKDLEDHKKLHLCDRVRDKTGRTYDC